jgi:sulfur carrier protein ThiS
MTTAEKIESVKTAIATRMFWDGVKIYGSKGQALRAYDSQTVEEAIEMLKTAAHYSIFKVNGEIVIQPKSDNWSSTATVHTRQTNRERCGESQKAKYRSGFDSRQLS